MKTTEDIIDILEELEDMFEDEDELVEEEQEIEEKPVLDYNLLHDKNYLLNFLKYNAEYYNQIPEDMRNDSDIAHVAIKNNASNIYFIGEQLQSDEEFLFSALKNNPYIFEHLPENVRHNDKIGFFAVEQKGNNFAFVSDRLKDDKYVAMAAIQTYSTAFQYCSENLRNNLEVVLYATSVKAENIAYLGDSFKNNIPFLSSLLARNIDIMPMVHHDAKEVLTNDVSLFKLAVRKHAHALQFASENLKNNKDLVTYAVAHFSESLRFASENLKQDRHFLLTLAEKNIDVLSYIQLPKEEKVRNLRELKIYLRAWCLNDKMSKNDDKLLKKHKL